MKPLLLLAALLLAGCATSNFDKRITCVGAEAYYVNKLGPAALIDRVPDADSLCARPAPKPAPAAS